MERKEGARGGGAKRNGGGGGNVRRRSGRGVAKEVGGWLLRSHFLNLNVYFCDGKRFFFGIHEVSQFAGF